MNELFSNWDYWTPKDKEHLLFDFYALSLVNPERLDDINMKIAFKQAKEEIVKALVEDFKGALAYALASEFRHVGGESAVLMIKRVRAGDVARDNYNNHFDKINERKFGKQFLKLMFKTRWDRDASFKTIRKMKISPSKMSVIYSKTFLSVHFARGMPGYGGKPWAMIADAWGRLYTTKGTNNLMVLVDHIYDLQHNNDTVFDKVKKYYKRGGLRWLKNALNFKRDIKDPFALYDNISPGLQDPYAYVMKMQNGITLQAFREADRTIRKGDKVKVRDDMTIDNHYGPEMYQDDHDNFAGLWVTIIKVVQDVGETYYKIKGNPKLFFSREMFDVGLK